jgi:hypothetical protein
VAAVRISSLVARASLGRVRAWGPVEGITIT